MYNFLRFYRKFFLSKSFISSYLFQFTIFFKLIKKFIILIKILTLISNRFKTKIYKDINRVNLNYLTINF